MAGGSSELKIFEALESYTMDDSFCSKASFVQNFLQCDLDLNNTQQSLQIDDILEEEESSSSSDDSDGTSYISVNSDVDNEENLVDDDIAKDAHIGKLMEKGTRAALLSLLLKRHAQGDKENNGEEEREVEKLGQILEEEDESDKEGGHGNGGNHTIVEEVNQVQVLKEKEDDEASQLSGNEDEGDHEEMDTKSTMRTGVGGVDNWSQYFQLLELKKSLEMQRQHLDKEKESYAKVKSSEENRMKAEKKRVESQRKSLQTLVADYDKMKFSREEYEKQIKQLATQLKETKLQMNKRITRFSDQQKRLEERVKTLEKENEELKKNQSRSIPQRLAALKRPPMRCLATNNNKQKPQNQQSQQRRVQFADELNREEDEGGDSGKENDSLTPNSTQNSSSISDNRSPGEEGIVSRKVEDESPKEIQLSDDDSDKTMPSDYVEIKHPCGTITRITKDNKFKRHILINKDIMDEFEDASVRYYYHELRFSQTTYPNGEEIIEYDSGEIETRRADGSRIYTYSNGLVKMVDGVSGAEEVIFSDGSIVKNTADGECTITWPSGQKEVRCANYVKRIYTNGTVKIMYQDGSEETRYFNGRVRRKDKNGMLVDDTKKVKTKK